MCQLVGKGRIKIALRTGIVRGSLARSHLTVFNVRISFAGRTSI
jgi:hypothetical protein